MPKKILAILATARTGGNTNALLEHCAKGAEEMGAQVEVLPIAPQKLRAALAAISAATITPSAYKKTICSPSIRNCRRQMLLCWPARCTTAAIPPS